MNNIYKIKLKKIYRKKAHKVTIKDLTIFMILIQN